MEPPVAEPDEASEDAAVAPTWPALRAIAPRLRAMVLFGGSVRESALSRALGRSMLELPLGDGRTILGAWVAQCAELARAAGLESLPLRILVNRPSDPPSGLPQTPDVRVSIEADREELRGTGGLLRDLTEGYEPDDLLLVANAHQVFALPLAQLADSLAAAMGDAALLATEDKAPCGLELFRCKALRTIKPKGFIDLKEQALTAITARFDVRVVTSRSGVVFPIRTVEGYLAALRAIHGRQGEEAADPLAEDWFPSFSLIEEGAVVSSAARVHDSVVLRGARVGAGAVLVRSLLCEGAVVGPAEVVADRIVPGPQGRGGERAR